METIDDKAERIATGTPYSFDLVRSLLDLTTNEFVITQALETGASQAWTPEMVTASVQAEVKRWSARPGQ